MPSRVADHRRLGSMPSTKLGPGQVCGWLIGLALTTSAATADPIDLGPATLALDETWTGPAVGAAPIVSVARGHGSAQLVVVRSDIPNLEAWRARTRPAHVDAIIAGFAASPGYAAIGKPRVRRLGAAAVPTLELTFRRRGPSGVEVVAVRVLLFRTLTIAAIAAAPSDRALVVGAVGALTPD